MSGLRIGGREVRTLGWSLWSTTTHWGSPALSLYIRTHDNEDCDTVNGKGFLGEWRQGRNSRFASSLIKVLYFNKAWQSFTIPDPEKALRSGEGPYWAQIRWLLYWVLTQSDMLLRARMSGDNIGEAASQLFCVPVSILSHRSFIFPISRSNLLCSMHEQCPSK